MAQVDLLLSLLLLENATDVLREHFSKLHSPLVVGVDVVDESFCGNSVLVESEELPSCEGIKSLLKEKKAEGRSVALKLFVVQQMLWTVSALQLLLGLSKGQSVWLSKEVAHQFFMGGALLTRQEDGLLRSNKADELSWHYAALMH